MKILILDDDELVLKWLKCVFEKLGAVEVCGVRDVEDFRFQLSLKHFDLCVLDVLLPGSINGVEVVEKLGIDSSQTSIWFISGVVRKDSIPASIRSRVDLFLSKPINETLITSEFRKLASKEEKFEDFLFSFYKEQVSSVDVLKILEEQKSVTDHQLAVLYFLCAFSHFSGHIILKNEQTQAELFFSEGRLICTKFPHRKSYLGVLMAAYGFAPAQDIKKVLAHSKPGLIGEKLIKYGFISPHSLGFILKEQTKIRLSELIQKDLSYSIKVQQLSLNAVSESFGLEDMRVLLAEMLWSKIDAEWICNFFEIKSYDFIYKSKTMEMGKNTDQTGWIEKGKDILSLIRDGDTLLNIVNKAVHTLSLPKEEVQFCLYYMLIIKTVYLEKNSDSAQNIVQIEDKLMNFKKRMKTQNYYELFNLHTNDSVSKVKERIIETLSFFHPDQYKGRISLLMEQQCHEIVSHINKIKEILLNDSKREKYIKKLHMGFQEDVLEGLVQLSKVKDLIQKKNFSGALSVLEPLQDQKGVPPVIHLYYCWMYMKVLKKFKNSEDRDRILYKIERTSVENKYSYLYYYCKALFMMKKEEPHLAKQMLKRCLNLESEFVHAKIDLAEVEQSLKQSGFFKHFFKAG